MVSSAPPTREPDAGPPALGPAIAKYGLARAALVAAVSALLTWVGVPLLVAIIIGLVVALPLSLVLLPSLREELDTALVAAGSRRREQKARLRAQLRGEITLGEGEPDPGAERPGEHDKAAGAEHRDEIAAPDTAEHPPHR